MVARQQGWVPRQHGAWAMLAVPLITGLVLRGRLGPLDIWLLPFSGAVFTGYFGFNALTLWLKTTPKRRAALLRPNLVYGVATAVLAVAVLATGGWPLLGWAVVAAPLAGLAIWCASKRNERGLASGFATVALAIGAGLVLRFPSPITLVSGWPAGLPDALIFGALFGYFFGTVLHVKALIRQRGQQAARLRSLGWHAAVLIAMGVAAALGWASPLWVGFFILTLARTWWLTRPELPARIKPLHIGLGEIACSLLALLLALT